MGQIKAKDLTGSMVALITPMHADGEINLDQWQELIKMHITCGTQAIIVGGTTGESALLTNQELSTLINTAVELCKDSNTIVIVGTGGIEPQKIKKTNQLASDLNADAVLVVTPYYLLISQKALLNHFTDIANASKLPIILYNVPNRTGIDLAAETTARLSKHNNIIGIKEALSDPERIKSLLKLHDFSILSGDDHSFVKSMSMGAHGVIIVAANIRPKTIKKLCTLVQLGNITEAEHLNTEMKPLYDLLFHEPNPCPLKAIMAEAGMISNGIRSPLELSSIKTTELKQQIKSIRQELNTL